MNKSDLNIRVNPGSEDLMVYICDDRDTADGLRRHGVESTLLLISGYDWNRYLSPWPSRKVFRGGEDFGGQADELIPAIEEVLEDYPSAGRIFCAGYSLAGLFALYFCTRSSRFDGCVSASGSLWYPGFTEYLQKNPVLCQSVYLSLGDKEKNTKNPDMALVQKRTEETAALLKQHMQVFFEMNPGNHFHDPEGRISKGMRYLENHDRK